MKEYIKPEVEYVQLVTEVITDDPSVDLGNGDNTLTKPSWLLN